MKPAIHAHDFEPSGRTDYFLSGELLEACRWCGYPADEHSPIRPPSRHIIAANLDDRRTALWKWGPWRNSKRSIRIELEAGLPGNGERFLVIA